jgi:hypothetical protein
MLNKQTEKTTLFQLDRTRKAEHSPMIIRYPLPPSPMIPSVNHSNTLCSSPVLLIVQRCILESVGINRRLLLGSTVGSFADQPSALLPITESTIERTNTRDVGVRRSSTGDEHLREDHEAMELESWFALRTTEQLFCFLALLFKGKIQEVTVDPAAMRGVPARRAPPLHYLHEHAWRRGPATPKDSPSHRTCTGDPPKQEKITSERARIIQHFSP